MKGAPKFVPGPDNGLRDLGPIMAEKLPERLRNDPQTKQEIGRLMLIRTCGSTSRSAHVAPAIP